MPPQKAQRVQLWQPFLSILRSLKTISSGIQSRSLCTSCASLDLVQIFNFGALELENDNVSWKYSPVCQFCRFVQGIAEAPSKFQGRSDSLFDETTLLWLVISRHGSVYRLSSTNNAGNWTLYRIAVGVDRFPNHHIQLVNETKRDSKTPDSLLYGRNMGLEFDFQLAKDWLRRCNSHHSGQCSPVNLETYAPKEMVGFTFRVIDVHRRRVLEAPTGCRNIALSYVWGETDQLKLEKWTVQRLMADGGLADSHDDISITARDAMIACERLGERFLWVDALCILQDDVDDREQQIQRMDLVYKGAVLTIVNGAAQAADEPYLVFGETLGQYFLRLLFESPWKSRGWTFQEETLSSRLKIFTRGQVFWECRRRNWWEDTIFETSDNDLVIDLPDAQGAAMGLKEYSVFSRYRDPIHNRRHYPLGGTPDLTRYGNLVTKYSNRELRYDSDALRAFTGILRDFRNKLDGFPNTFFFGLPTVAFDRSLLWDFGPERDTEKVPKRRNILPRLPSWSWGGWKSSVSYLPRNDMTVFHDLSIRQSIPRKDIIWHLSGSLTPLPTYSGYREVNEDRVDLELNWIPSDAQTAPLDSDESCANTSTLSTLRIPTLRFWTQLCHALAL